MSDICLIEMDATEDNTPTLLIDSAEIKALVARIAREIERDLSGDRKEPPILIGVLKGAFVFTADLMRELKIPVEVGFIRTTSYGLRASPTAKVDIVQDIEIEIKDRNVILVEDIIDRGKTIVELTDHIKKKHPASIRICALLSRRDANDIKADHLGRTITDDRFVVGYGMDYKERYRDLPGLYTIEPTQNKEEVL